MPTNSFFRLKNVRARRNLRGKDPISHQPSKLRIRIGNHQLVCDREDWKTSITWKSACWNQTRLLRFHANTCKSRKEFLPWLNEVSACDNRLVAKDRMAIFDIDMDVTAHRRNSGDDRVDRAAGSKVSISKPPDPRLRVQRFVRPLFRRQPKILA